jgi:hypothetical protein
MNTLVWSRTTLIWLLLVAATTLSWKIGHGMGASEVKVISAVIIIIAFVKVRFVVFEFMEMRGAPAWMRRAGNGWIMLTTSLLIARVLIAQ